MRVLACNRTQVIDDSLDVQRTALANIRVRQPLGRLVLAADGDRPTGCTARVADLNVAGTDELLGSVAVRNEDGCTKEVSVRCSKILQTTRVFATCHTRPLKPANRIR